MIMSRSVRFNLEKTNLDQLAAHFLALGLRRERPVQFSRPKKLDAKTLRAPGLNQARRCFISQLRVEELSEGAQKIIQGLVAQMSEEVVTADNFLYSGRHWQLSSEEYQALISESEYAGWLAAWGFRANHFTVSVNHLNNSDSLEQVNTLLKEAGFCTETPLVVKSKAASRSSWLSLQQWPTKSHWRSVIRR